MKTSDFKFKIRKYEEITNDVVIFYNKDGLQVSDEEESNFIEDFIEDGWLPLDRITEGEYEIDDDTNEVKKALTRGGFVYVK